MGSHLKLSRSKTSPRTVRDHTQALARSLEPETKESLNLSFESAMSSDEDSMKLSALYQAATPASIIVSLVTVRKLCTIRALDYSMSRFL